MREPKNIALIQKVITLTEQGVDHAEIGRQTDRTRERIRQIYAKYGTIPYSEIHKQKAETAAIQRAEKIAAAKREIKFLCEVCQSPATFESHRTKYCSEKCATIMRVKQSALTQAREFTCMLCEKKFKIHYQQRQGHNLVFCKRAHFHRFLAIYRQSKYSKRMKAKTEKIKSLNDTIGWLRLKVEKQKIKIALLEQKPKVIIKEKIIKDKPIKIVVVKKERQIPTSSVKLRRETRIIGREGKCTRCTMIIVGEFAEYASQIKPSLCRGCDGSVSILPERSLMASGTVTASRRIK